MATATSYKSKDGSSFVETYEAFTVGSATVVVPHNLGAIPDEVVITPTAGYIVYLSAKSATTVTVIGGNASAAIELTLKKHNVSSSITNTLA